MHIAIDSYCFHLRGGVEFFAADFSNFLVSKGHRVTLFTSSPRGANPVFFLDDQVRVIYHKSDFSQKNLMSLQKQLELLEVDCFLSPSSAKTILFWEAVLQKTGIPIIYQESTDPERVIGFSSAAERDAYMWGVDHIQLFINDFLSSVPDACRNKVSVIPHAVEQHQASYSISKKDKFLLLSLGRWDSVKQVHLLIQAFSMIALDFPDWTLEIWGYGEEEQLYNACVQYLSDDLKKRIHVKGVAENPDIIYPTADIFCIPSKYEGFGRTILEAMSYGLPVVGFSDCLAVKNVVKHGVTGFLANDMTAECLANSLRYLMIHDEKRALYSSNALVEVESNYSKTYVYGQCLEMLQKVALCKGKTKLIGLYDAKNDSNPYACTLRAAIDSEKKDYSFVKRFISKMLIHSSFGVFCKKYIVFLVTRFILFLPKSIRETVVIKLIMSKK